MTTAGLQRLCFFVSSFRLLEAGRENISGEALTGRIQVVCSPRMAGPIERADADGDTGLEPV